MTTPYAAPALLSGVLAAHAALLPPLLVGPAAATGSGPRPGTGSCPGAGAERTP
ncbi:hypothetical protein [Streptomyces sp. NPDC097619]|uniref:hypothetical protein n=1 Tax=Streptomyces sp. NPDC097619 TaxID=3157228 RepID=UPI0033188970